MANTEVSICNVSLVLLKQNTIISLTDNTTIGETCNLFYPRVRNDLLSAYPWNFATKRTTLAQSATAPDWGYNYQYPLPADYIKLLQMQDEDNYAYVIEQRNILTDASTCKIKYIFEQTDTAKFSEAFANLLSYRLAATMAYTITGKKSMTEIMWQLYSEIEMESFNTDSQEGSEQPVFNDDLIAVR